jgi:6-phospho-3-hexuloisomerase
MNTVITKVLTEITTSVSQVSIDSLTQAQTMMTGSKRIFLAGAGRSGLCMRSLGMRLMHLGKSAYVVGETSTPSIQAGDLLILGSGSGRTDSLLIYAQKARNQDADILLFTTDWGSPLAELSHHLVLVPAPSYQQPQTKCSFNSLQPLGSLFEQSLLILCDCLTLGLMESMAVGVDFMKTRHANLE